MIKAFKAVALGLSLLLAGVSVCYAQDFQKGFAAYKAKDDKEAARLFGLAAAQGDEKAQYNLGVMYHEGTGVTQNYKEAVRLYGLAAAQGYVSAQTNLGGMYANSQGVTQDSKEAIKWYRLAAEQGNADAQYNLGWMYYIGLGIIQDNVYAYMWYNIAASGGDANAVNERDVIAKKMTPSQLEKAQDLASECVKKN